jgi:uncharacterized protein
MKMNSKQNLIFRLVIRLASSILVVLGLVQCAQAQVTNAEHAGIQSQITNAEFLATQSAADQGDAKAQYELARFYAKGVVVPRNYAKAVECLRQSADQGYADAQLVLGTYYALGRGVHRNMTDSALWYQKAADQGNASAQFALGGLYLKGNGVTNDVLKALKLWRKAAGQNLVEAQAALGQFYLMPAQPYGTNYLNYAEALQWLRAAAAAGSAKAMNDLGAAYESGMGLARDNKEAAKWYRLAAEHGEDQAQANLGQLYFDGRGVDLDLVQAYKWFKLSANRANNMGILGYQHFTTANLLSPEQLAEAERMVSDFHPQAAKSQP